MRLCRWLLELADRCGGQQVAKYCVKARMLGARRQQISLSAAALQRRGIIEYLNGEMEILNRPKLESLSCECYCFAQGIYRSIMHDE